MNSPTPVPAVTAPGVLIPGKPGEPEPAAIRMSVPRPGVVVVRMGDDAPVAMDPHTALSMAGELRRKANKALALQKGTRQAKHQERIAARKAAEALKELEKAIVKAERDAKRGKAPGKAPAGAVTE